MWAGDCELLSVPVEPGQTVKEAAEQIIDEYADQCKLEFKKAAICHKDKRMPVLVSDKKWDRIRLEIGPHYQFTFGAQQPQNGQNQQQEIAESEQSADPNDIKW